MDLEEDRVDRSGRRRSRRPRSPRVPTGRCSVGGRTGRRPLCPVQRHRPLGLGHLHGARCRVLALLHRGLSLSTAPPKPAGLPDLVFPARIVLKNPGVGLLPKKGFAVVFAHFDVERALGEASKPTGWQLPLKAGPPFEIFRCASVASTIVIGAKIRVFDHNRP